jgi:hypothetical protein
MEKSKNNQLSSMGVENKIAAVNIGVNLSNQIITAALAMIAVLGAFTTYAIEKREVGFGFYLLIGMSFASFVISIFKGGKGIDKARKCGADGNWEPNNTESHFNWQGILCFVGIILFCVSVFIGNEKKDDLTNKVSELTAAVVKLKISDSLNNRKYSQLLSDFIFQKHQIDSLVANKADSTKSK